MSLLVFVTFMTKLFYIRQNIFLKKLRCDAGSILVCNLTIFSSFFYVFNNLLYKICSTYLLHQFCKKWSPMIIYSMSCDWYSVCGESETWVYGKNASDLVISAVILTLFLLFFLCKYLVLKWKQFLHKYEYFRFQLLFNVCR